LSGEPGGLPEGERLQKVLAQAGIGSRRVCEIYIDEGRISVNGVIAHLGQRVDPLVDVVEFDGSQIGVKPGLVHYLLNKPAGVVTTAQDAHGCPALSSSWCPPSPGCSRWAASTPTPRACCSSRTTVT